MNSVRTNDRAAFTFLGAGLLLFFLAFLPPAIFSTDGNSMLAVSESLLHGSFAVPQDLGTEGSEGHYYSQWYPLLSLLAVPFVLAGRLAGTLAGVSLHHAGGCGAISLNCLIVAGTTVLVAITSRCLGASARRSYLAGIVFGLGTYVIVYAHGFYAEPLLAMLTLAAFCAAFSSPVRWGVLCVACFLAPLAKPTGAAMAVFLTAYLLYRMRDKKALLPLGGMIAGIVTYGIYNFLRFGSFTDFGERPGFGMSKFLVAFPGLLVSPGFGLIWFAPVILTVLFLRNVSRLRAELVIVISFSVFTLCIYSLRPTDWFGGWSWGPRFLLPCVALLIPFLALLENRKFRYFLVLGTITFVMHLPTLVSYYERIFMTYSDDTAGYELAWSPADSPLLQAWPSAVATMRDAAQADASEFFRSDSVRPRGQLTRVVAAWWWFLPGAGVPRLIAWMIPVMLCAGSFLCLRAGYLRTAKEAG